MIGLHLPAAAMAESFGVVLAVAAAASAWMSAFPAIQGAPPPQASTRMACASIVAPVAMMVLARTAIPVAPMVPPIRRASPCIAGPPHRVLRSTVAPIESCNRTAELLAPAAVLLAERPWIPSGCEQSALQRPFTTLLQLSRMLVA